MVQKCEVEDLPPGWTKEIRIRKTSKIIRKDPVCVIFFFFCFKFMFDLELSSFPTSPSSSSWTYNSIYCNHKLFVLRWSCCQLIRFLFIKYCTYRLNSQYYTDPVSGYIFRSKKAALHYVATGEISRHVIKPKNSEQLMKDEIEVSATFLARDYTVIFIVYIFPCNRFVFVNRVEHANDLFY